ncbi:MAG: sigma-70 family RNA polymerase sigma factor [Candidatus Sulfotelmatobacter sp.]
MTTDTHRAIDAVWRIESPRLIAGLARIVRDVGIAEDLAQDALVAALEQWPKSGVPDNPGAWLMAAAKHRAIDYFRRTALLDRKHEELAREFATREMVVPDFNAALDDDVGDDLLRLVFVSCHPVLSTETRVALTLRLLGGLTTAEIAGAFLVPEPTIAQRIVRAKRTLAEKRVPFEVPRGPELAARLSSVLEVIYLVFNEGYSATAGDDWMRPALCEDALRVVIDIWCRAIYHGHGKYHAHVNCHGHDISLCPRPITIAHSAEQLSSNICWPRSSGKRAGVWTGNRNSRMPSQTWLQNTEARDTQSS